MLIYPEAGSEYLVAWVKNKLRQWHAQMIDSNMVAQSRTVQVSTGTTIYVKMERLPDGTFRDTVRITGGAFAHAYDDAGVRVMISALKLNALGTYDPVVATRAPSLNEDLVLAQAALGRGLEGPARRVLGALVGNIAVRVEGDTSQLYDAQLTWMDIRASGDDWRVVLGLGSPYVVTFLVSDLVSATAGPLSGALEFPDVTGTYDIPVGEFEGASITAKLAYTSGVTVTAAAQIFGTDQLYGVTALQVQGDLKITVSSGTVSAAISKAYVIKDSGGPAVVGTLVDDNRAALLGHTPTARAVHPDGSVVDWWSDGAGAEAGFVMAVDNTGAQWETVADVPGTTVLGSTVQGEAFDADEVTLMSAFVQYDWDGVQWNRNDGAVDPDTAAFADPVFNVAITANRAGGVVTDYTYAVTGGVTHDVTVTTDPALQGASLGDRPGDPAWVYRDELAAANASPGYQTLHLYEAPAANGPAFRSVVRHHPLAMSAFRVFWAPKLLPGEVDGLCVTAADDPAAYELASTVDAVMNIAMPDPDLQPLVIDYLNDVAIPVAGDTAGQTAIRIACGDEATLLSGQVDGSGHYTDEQVAAALAWSAALRALYAPAVVYNNFASQDTIDYLASLNLVVFLSASVFS